ncbi:hypothetical protein NDU88_001071 [Pleurodeles waltl]|uniref:Uncharacterized protein n=1 Tax=Pleurodeles waltl TaxID=8319 RepID=A0AAV7RAK6_PLEWA|nr:hypothetical protein NDU88_001071 [Pleurodeles waltl]
MKHGAGRDWTAECRTGPAMERTVEVDGVKEPGGDTVEAGKEERLPTRLLLGMRKGAGCSGPQRIRVYDRVVYQELPWEGGTRLVSQISKWNECSIGEQVTQSMEACFMARDNSRCCEVCPPSGCTEQRKEGSVRHRCVGET